MNDSSSTPSRGPPEILIPLVAVKVGINIVVGKEDRSNVVGVQFVVGSEVVHTQRFRSPLKLNKDKVSDITLEIQQVIGIPANDGKQQNILAGISNNSTLCPCPACTREKSGFGKLSQRMWKLKKARGLVEGDCPHEDAQLRDGDMSLDACAKR